MPRVVCTTPRIVTQVLHNVVCRPLLHIAGARSHSDTSVAQSVCRPLLRVGRANSLRLVCGVITIINKVNNVLTSLFPCLQAIISCSCSHPSCSVGYLVSNASIYRNIKLSMLRFIERVLPSDPLPGLASCGLCCNLYLMATRLPFI